MECKNIWFINAGEPLPIQGNKPHRMSHWMTRLSILGHKVTFFTTDFEHQRKSFINSTEIPDNYELLESKVSYSKNVSIKRLINHFYLGRSLKKRLDNTPKPDLLVCSYPTIYSTFIATKFAKKHNIPVVIDVRDLWPDIFISPKIGQLILMPLYQQKKYIFKNATRVIGVSPKYVSWASPNADTEVNTLPLSQYHASPKSAAIKDNICPIKLIFVGTLGTTYDLILISVISELLTKNNIEHQMTVCGEGPQKVFLTNSTKNNPNVVFRGWLKKNELDRELKDSHLGLMLYKSKSPQGWPNKLIEYMSYGLPIINSLKGESWHIIEQNGIGVNIERDNLEPIINWIQKDIVQNYHAISDKTLNAFHENFDEETIFNKLLNIIENVTTNS